MEQKDFLVRHFEELAKLIGLLLGFKEKGKATEALEEINNAFPILTGLTLSESENILPETFLSFLLKEKNIKKEQLESLAELLYWRGIFLQQQNDLSYNDQFKKSLLLLEHLQNTTKAFSMEWEGKIKEIKRRV